MADLDLVHGWMHQPHVVPFWRLDLPRTELATYLTGATGDDHQDVLIGSVHGWPVSYWEVYWAQRDPLAVHYDAQPYDQGVHLLIGPPERTGRGLGRRLLSSLVAWQFARDARTTHVVAEPDIRNERVHRTFAACGFEARGEIDLPDKRALLMICDRDRLGDGRR
ncbi:MAG: GNAT family N-acetyltransferase [Nitriliruptorales bacterium]|nr:GNAT family N-acetyltransferase [Nitriliruptorales bacterium]